MENKNEINKLSSHFVKTLNDSVAVPAEGSKSPIAEKIEAMAKQAPVAPATPPTIKLNGYEIYADAQVFLMFLLASELSRQPRINKLLKQIKFSFKDVNGKQVYPKKAKKAK
jgi:hypothetical protein